MSCTQGDEVTVVDVVDGRRGVAIDRGSVGIGRRGACRRVTAGKHGIVNLDAGGIKGSPSGVTGLVLQVIEHGGGNVLALAIMRGGRFILNVS